MRKLTLDVETLEVESFRTDARQPSRGTVLGADGAMTVAPYCVTFTCGDSQIRPCLAG